MTEYSTTNPISELLMEWEDLINELSSKEVALFQWKECYQIKSEEIIKETDFKELYGKNNEGIRKEHVKHELVEWYDTIKDLEFSISYIERRISYLKFILVSSKTSSTGVILCICNKELIRVKRLIYEVQVCE